MTVDYFNKKLSKQMLLLSLVFLYLIPMSIFDNQDVFRVNKAIFNIIILIIYSGYLIRGHIRINISDMVILFFMIFRFVLTLDLESFGLSYMLIIRHLDFEDMDLRNHKILLYLIVLSIPLYSILHHKNFSIYLISTSIGEINQVGFTLIMLYLIFKYIGYKKLSYLMIFFGILTFSRNFILAVILYEVSNYILHNKRKYKIIRKLPINFRTYSVLSLVIVISLYFVFSQISDTSQFSNYENMLQRYFTYFDNSNYQRFIANIAVLKFYKFVPRYLITGVKFDTYKDYLIKYKFGFGLVEGKINAPHNYYFKFLYKYGIFSFYIFNKTAREIDKRLNLDNLSIFLVFMFYATFLGTGFYENYFIILLYLLDFKKKKEEENLRAKNQIQFRGIS